MSYFAVDDEMHAHRKFVGLSLAAVGLWVRCGSWSKKQRTGGHVTMGVIRMLGGNAKLARELCAVQAGCERALWFQTDEGFQFHDWERYQTRGVAMTEAERAAKYRQEKKRREEEAAALAAGERHEKRDAERDAERDGACDSDRDNVTSLPARAHAHGVGMGVGNSPSSTEHGDDPPVPRQAVHDLARQYAEDAGLASDMDLTGNDRWAAEQIVQKSMRAGHDWRGVYARWRGDKYVTDNRLPLTHLSGVAFPKYLADIAKPPPKGPAKASPRSEFNTDPEAPLVRDL